MRFDLYIDNKTKQESIALVDELIQTSKYESQKTPLYPHDWVDNYGKNDWEYWVTYVQDKENTIWEATLNIATTANGEKILYDIYPIKMMEQSVESDTSPSNTKIAHPKAVVNQKTENSDKKSSYRDPNRQAQKDKINQVLEKENAKLREIISITFLTFYYVLLCFCLVAVVYKIKTIATLCFWLLAMVELFKMINLLILSIFLRQF